MSATVPSSLVVEMPLQPTAPAKYRACKSGSASDAGSSKPSSGESMLAISLTVLLQAQSRGKGTASAPAQLPPGSVCSAVQLFADCKTKIWAQRGPQL